MKYTDELHIAGTAALLCAAMLAISVVVPQEIRIPTANTTLEEAPETAAEAEAQAEEAGFPIYTQESNYDYNDYETSESSPSGETSQDDITYYEEPQPDSDAAPAETEDDTSGQDNTGSDPSQEVYPEDDSAWDVQDGSGDDLNWEESSPDDFSSWDESEEVYE